MKRALALLALAGVAAAQIIVLPKKKAAGGGGTPAHVQNKSTTKLFTSDNNIAVTMDSNGTSGNALVAFLAYSSTTLTVSSITGCGGTFTQVGSNVDASSFRHSWWVAPNITGGACTISVTLSGTSASSKFLAVHEASSIATSSPVDVSTITSNSAGSGTDVITTGAFTTTVSNTYVMGVMYSPSFNGQTPSAGTGYTIRELANGSGQMLASETQIRAAAGSGAVTFSTSGFTSYVIAGIALKP